MTRKKIAVVIGILNTLTCCFTAAIFLLSKTKTTTMLSPIPADYINKTETKVLGSTVYAAPVKPVNILLLGLDGRRGDKNPRCDAIHLISIDPSAAKIRINSIPRGTKVNMPSIASESAYLGNSCHVMGIDFAKGKVEKITNSHADYLVKVGFSQTLGIFRTLSLPTTSTLQFLRNRHYGIGDNQRSRNQALFIKSMLLSHLEEYYKLPKPIKYLVYKMADTNIDFETADNLILQIIDRGLLKNPDNIELKTYLSPRLMVRDIYYTEENGIEVAEKQDDEEFQEYQQGLEVYLNNLIEKGDNFLSVGRQNTVYQLIKTPFSQKLWLQIEDDAKRNQYYYDFLRLYVLSSPDKSTTNSLVLDFITEMEANNQPEFKEKGEKLLII